MASYSELRVRFEPAGSEPGSYDVLATGPTGETTGQFRLPLSKLELENIALRLSRGRNVVRRVDSPELELVRGLGGSLFEALFSGRSATCTATRSPSLGRRGEGCESRSR